MMAQRALRRASQAVWTSSSSSTSHFNALQAISRTPRHSSSSSATTTTAPEESNHSISPRWLSTTKARIGKCITFGMPTELVDSAGQTLRTLGQEWRELVAGSEGYLTERRRAGLHRQRVVWGEQDSMGHVNNVVYVRYAESGRCNWMRNFGKLVDEAKSTANSTITPAQQRRAWADLLTSRSIGLILKSITVDFKFPMTYPDRVSVYHKLRSRPDANSESLILDVLILSEARQRPAARCLEDVVVYDYRVGKKCTLEPFMVDELQRTFDLQEAAKRQNHDKVQRIERQVRDLELKSWDRPDAKEDLGSAAQK